LVKIAKSIPEEIQSLKIAVEVIAPLLMGAQPVFAEVNNQIPSFVGPGTYVSRVERVY
jgi:hypothetical protein